MAIRVLRDEHNIYLLRANSETGGFDVAGVFSLFEASSLSAQLADISLKKKAEAFERTDEVIKSPIKIAPDRRHSPLTRPPREERLRLSALAVELNKRSITLKQACQMLGAYSHATMSRTLRGLPSRLATRQDILTRLPLALADWDKAHADGN